MTGFLVALGIAFGFACGYFAGYNKAKTKAAQFIARGWNEITGYIVDTGRPPGPDTYGHAFDLDRWGQ